MFASSKDNKTNAARDDMSHEGGTPVDSIKDAARQFKGEARDAANAIKDDLEGVARQTGHHMRALADSAGHSLSGVWQTTMLKIRDKPIQSSAIALGVGLVVGLIYRRR